MPRSLSVFVLVVSLVLNGCAVSSRSAQPEALAGQRNAWDAPPEEPKGGLRTWSKEHPWQAGFAVAGIVVGCLAVLFVGALAVGLSQAPALPAG